jgi:signal recognition particle receptor subunit beta
MVVVSYSGREINAKIVYYGPGLSGKTTNLEKIYDSVPESNRGRMVSMKTQTDRTLFFDLLPLDLGELQGMKTRFLLYTVPGQVYYNATRKLVLKGVDALVFVADSAPEKMAENRESLSNLEQNLKSYGLDLKAIPWVIQFNKRDLPNALAVAQMNKDLNKYNVPTFEAQAASGIGVFETLRGVSKLLLTKISKDVIDRDRGSLAASPRVKAEEAKKPAAVEEAPTQSSEQGGRGKLMQFLKRGKGQEAPAPPGRAPIEEAPVLGEEITLDAPASGAFTPPPSMQPDEGVLTNEDLVPIQEPAPRRAAAPRTEPQIVRQPEPQIVRQPEPQIIRQPEPQISSDDSEPVFGAGEIERESTYGGRSDVEVRSPSADTRQITVPIELGSLPASGRLKVVFEVHIEIEQGAGQGKKGKQGVRGGSMMRDLEVIPD